MACRSAASCAIVSMKHVGLNVAADAFVNSAMTGANGGLLVVSADDPSMHSSQNEQDSRFYADFAMVPVLEPSNQQEAYDMARYGFDLSEKHRIPVMIRLVTRLSHSRGVVATVAEPDGENGMSYPQNPRQWVLMPGNSKVRYPQLIEDYAALAGESCRSPFNTLTWASDRSLGIITTGIAYNYLTELFPGGVPFPVLKISQYPLPVDMIRDLAAETDALLILEEGQPYVERQLRGLLDRGGKVYGKLDGKLNRTGELTPDRVREALVKVCPSLAGDLTVESAGGLAGDCAASAGVVPGVRTPRRVLGAQRGVARI